jgi:hypothetical protein
VACNDEISGARVVEFRVTKAVRKYLMLNGLEREGCATYIFRVKVTLTLKVSPASSIFKNYVVYIPNKFMSVAYLRRGTR